MSKGLVVITGASSGFGEATALSFAKLGHALALGARRVEKLRAVAAACERAGAPRVLAQALDVTDRKSIEEFAIGCSGPRCCAGSVGLWCCSGRSMTPHRLTPHCGAASSTPC